MSHLVCKYVSSDWDKKSKCGWPIDKIITCINDCRIFDFIYCLILIRCNDFFFIYWCTITSKSFMWKRRKKKINENLKCCLFRKKWSPKRIIMDNKMFIQNAVSCLICIKNRFSFFLCSVVEVAKRRLHRHTHTPKPEWIMK